MADRRTFRAYLSCSTEPRTRVASSCGPAITDMEYGSEHRQYTGGGARWRPDDGAPKADEVVVSGPRMLVSEGRAILAGTEDARYGKRDHGS